MISIYYNYSLYINTLQKYTHMRIERTGSLVHYTKQPLWWVGFILMVIGQWPLYSILLGPTGHYIHVCHVSRPAIISLWFLYIPVAIINVNYIIYNLWLFNVIPFLSQITTLPPSLSLSLKSLLYIPPSPSFSQITTLPPSSSPFLSQIATLPPSLSLSLKSLLTLLLFSLSNHYSPSSHLSLILPHSILFHIFSP